MNVRGKLEMFCQTDVGQVRDHNEDFIRYDDGLGVAVLADGMGGLSAGEVASSMTVHLLMETLVAYSRGKDAPTEAPIEALAEAVQQANSAVFHVSQTQPQCHGMGTTVVASLFYDNKLAVGHIGDSRLYRFRDKQLEQLTRDHSLVQEMLDKGLVTKAEARLSKKKNVVTRALGVAPQVEVEVHEHATSPGDIYLLCSDGLTDLVTDEDIEASLRELGANLSVATAYLVNLANASGGKDNISIILVRVVKPYPAEGGIFEKIINWFE
jgi:serine/threonine protein phosphatase PrpC